MRKLILLFVVIILVASPALPVSAQQVPFIPADCTDSDEKETPCGLDDLIQVFINFGMILLGLTGSLALFFFIYGGYVWLTSGGSPERITKGKNIIVQSLIGILIVFGAAMAVRYFQESLGYKKQSSETQKNEHS